MNGDVLGSSAKAIRVEHLAPLGRAKALDCAFFFSRAFQQELLSTEAGVLITADAFVPAIHVEADRLPFYKRTAIIACPDAYYAMAVLSEHFAKGVSTVAHLEEEATSTVVHPTAVVDPTAKIGSGVRIGPHCVVDAGATIGRGTILYPRAHVGPSVEIGEDCVFFTGVTLYEWTKIGNRVRIHAGSTIGADGFGYAPVLEKGVPVGHRKIYHLGRVVIGSDVEIGANSMIDRATFGETVIGDQVKIDNHVHVGHNSVVGEGTILCGGVLLAGGTRIGKFVYVGGFTGIGNKAVIGDYAKVGGASMVDKDVPAGGTAVGIPQRTHREHFKVHALLNRLLLERDRRGRDAPKGK